HQAFGMLVVVVAMKSRIDRRADNALNLESFKCSNIGIEVYNRDALETALAFFNRIEHAGIVALVPGVGLHQERVPHAVCLHHPAKLRCRADFLPAGLVGDILVVRKSCRINDVDVAIDLRFVENMHRKGIPDAESETHSAEPTLWPVSFGAVE